MAPELAPFLPAVLFDWQRQDAERVAWEEEGALAFLDVSGFTAMSERLARLGREGAEVVTDVIGSTFETLLAVAYEAGGSLLKFGGDALLLWFGGDDAARRACQTAARTRAALRRLGPIPTPMGPVRLRMSAGVHAGTFQFFVVGDLASHRELLVCSPAASRTCVMESAANAGEILISPETAALIGPRWLGAESGPGVLLNTPPPGGERVAPSMPDVSGVDVAAFVPPMVRAAGDEPEHRHAAVGFVHFDGTDALIAERGLDAAAEQLHELVSVVQAACIEHGVAFLSSDVDVDGGKFLLCAGAPVSSPDDDERMLRTLRAIADAGTPVPVRAGANRGLLFAGSIGPSYRRSYTLMGDIVNTAARVMSNAAPGEVLTLKPVLDGAKSAFSTKRLPPFAAKGKSRPLVAYRVGRPTGHRERERAADAFVGRHAELAQLSALVEQAASKGQGGLIELRGELGVGKSRLLEEVCARLDDGVQCTTVRGNPYETAAPYAPLRRVIGEVLDRVDPALADADQAVFRARLHAEVVAHLDATVDSPWVLVVEEAQWLDEASAALVRHLGWQAGSRPWAVLTARWANDGPPVATGGVGTVLELAPLGHEDAERLVADRASFPLLPQQVDRVVERAAGNPLFLEQLVAAFDPDDDQALPAGLEAVVASRIDRLPVRERSSLRALSVLGVRFSLDDAPVVLGSSFAELEGLSEFLDVDGAGSVGAFRQSVFQSVAYAALSYRRRRELHERVALHAEARDAGESNAAMLAAHFDLAQRFDKAWKYAWMAATYAHEHHSHGPAAELYRRALHAAGRLGAGAVETEKLRDAWQGLGDSLRLMGRQADAVTPYQKARKLAGNDPLAQAHLCLREGDLRQRLGRPSLALRWLGRGLRLLDGSQDPEALRLRVRLLANAGRVRYDQGRQEDAVSALRAALATAEATGDMPGIAHACLWLSYSYAATRTPGHGELAQRALSLYEQLDAVPWQAAALNGLGVSARRDGRWDEGRELLEQAAERLLAIGDPLSAAIVFYNVADVYLDQERYDEAASSLRRVVRTFQAARHGYEPVASAALARALAQSAPDESDALFASAIDGMASSGLARFASEATTHWAEALVGRGDVERAVALLADRSPTDDPDVEARALRVSAMVADAQGDETVARERAEEALRVATEAGNAHAVGLARVLLTSSKTIWRNSCTDQSS